jgi:hypothetical protein
MMLKWGLGKINEIRDEMEEENVPREEGDEYWLDFTAMVKSGGKVWYEVKKKNMFNNLVKLMVRGSGQWAVGRCYID